MVVVVAVLVGVGAAAAAALAAAAAGALGGAGAGALGGGGGGAGQPHCSGALRRQLRIHCVQPAKLVVVLAMLPVRSALLLQLLRQDGDSWTPSPKLLNPESEHRSRS